MITDTEVKIKGIRALTDTLGKVGAERFIALIQREPFDYTNWQRTLWEGQSVVETSRNAIKISQKTEQDAAVDDGHSEPAAK